MQIKIEQLEQELKNKELQRLVNSSRKALRRAEDEIEKLTKENLEVYEENKDLRFENEEQKDFIKRIDKLVNSNKYNNEKAILQKVKELISDFDG